MRGSDPLLGGVVSPILKSGERATPKLAMDAYVLGNCTPSESNIYARAVLREVFIQSFAGGYEEVLWIYDTIIRCLLIVGSGIGANLISTTNWKEQNKIVVSMLLFSSLNVWAGLKGIQDGAMESRPGRLAHGATVVIGPAGANGD
jgi:hypothetical protein